MRFVDGPHGIGDTGEHFDGIFTRLAMVTLSKAATGGVNLHGNVLPALIQQEGGKIVGPRQMLDFTQQKGFGKLLTLIKTFGNSRQGVQCTVDDDTRTCKQTDYQCHRHIDFDLDAQIFPPVHSLSPSAATRRQVDDGAAR